MNAQKEYERWLAHCTGDTLRELKSIAGNNAEIEKRFSHRQAFGTAGIRSVMAAGIANLNEYTVRQAARGLAYYLAESGGDKSCAIGYDCRRNSRLFAEICAAALAESGIHADRHSRDDKQSQTETGKGLSGGFQVSRCRLLWDFSGCRG